MHPACRNSLNYLSYIYPSMKGAAPPSRSLRSNNPTSRPSIFLARSLPPPRDPAVPLCFFSCSLPNSVVHPPRHCPRASLHDDINNSFSDADDVSTFEKPVLRAKAVEDLPELLFPDAAAGGPVNRRAAATRRRYSELLSFFETHGHAEVPCDHPGGLGRWAAEQRFRWRRGRLPTPIFRALSALGFSFDAFDTKWAARFRQLAEFHSKHGHCRVPHAGPDSPPGLYPWLLEQRQKKRQGLLEDERSRRLEGLGFVWEPADARWETRYAELEAFVAARGHARVPRGWRENPALSLWVESTRAKWRARAGARPPGLSHSQEAMLRALGFEFEVQLSWGERMEQLRGIKAQAGHLRGRLPNSGIFVGLRDWTARQRALWRAGRLPPQRAAALEALGLELDAEGAAWRRGLAELDAYVSCVGFPAAYAHLVLLQSQTLLGGDEESGRKREKKGEGWTLVAWLQREGRKAKGARAEELRARGFGVYIGTAEGDGLRGQQWQEEAPS